MEVALTFILLGTGLFAMVFGIRYLQNKENMAMIQNGMDPGLKQTAQPYRNLKWALLLMGAGIGLLIAFLLDHSVLHQDNGFFSKGTKPIYPALIAIFSGLGLFVSYLIEKKETLNN